MFCSRVLLQVWFGIGFNASLMADTPYAIVVAGKTGAVSEHRLKNHEAGSLLPASVTVVSNTVADGVRTVVLSRGLKGASAQHYSFQPAALALDFIAAVGSGPAFAYHKAKNTATLSLWPATAGQAACVCTEPALPFGSGAGTIEYLPTGEKVGFRAGRCPPQPRGDLLTQANPTCDVRCGPVQPGPFDRLAGFSVSVLLVSFSERDDATCSRSACCSRASWAWTHTCNLMQNLHRRALHLPPPLDAARC